MDEQSGETEEEEVILAQWVSRNWRNWYQNEVDEEVKGVDSRDTMKHTERSDKQF